MTEWYRLRNRLARRYVWTRRLDSAVWFFVGMSFLLYLVSM